jgi:hypothetical protein
MAVTQVLSLFSKHRRRRRAGQGRKTADNTQKTSFDRVFHGEAFVTGGGNAA